MRILIVEDEAKIALAIKRGLEQETYSIDLAENGILGYDLAATEDYDLLIIDWMLPGLDGVQIVKKLREGGNTTPILLLTAKNELDDKVKGFQTGADDYLTKPFAFEELLVRVKSLLRRPKSYIGNTIECADLIINTDNYLVTRDNMQINLSKREFSLLEYLMRNQNKTITKEQIMAHVWDYESDILPNTVEQYVGYIRNKVDKAFPKKKQLIKTIRGFGYTMSCN